jgi:nucleoid-associated protein YgaU
VVHDVVPGDTLWDIAGRYIDDPWRYPELAALSNVANPHLIFPGQRIYIVFQ